MAKPPKSQFPVGAAVAIERGDHMPYVKMWVVTVQKNGNFRLSDRPGGRAEPQQYRNYGDRACSTGSSYVGGSTIVRPWSLQIAEEQRERLAAWRHRRRAADLRKLLEKPSAIDPDFLESICNIIAWRAITEGTR